MMFPAQSKGYAIGAFNVYNVEGVKAVVLAAEATQSPAILQVGHRPKEASSLDYEPVFGTHLFSTMDNPRFIQAP